MAHLFPNFEAYYRGYGLTERKDGTYVACNDTPELYGKCDYPNIGLGWEVDQGKTFDRDAICKRIDEVIEERDKRIAWVREFAQTDNRPSFVSSYLLDSCDPRNIAGHKSRSRHAQAELYDIWCDGSRHLMRYSMGVVAVSETLYLYRKFLITKGYIKDNKK